MWIFAEMRERFKIIRFLVNAQKTIWYPILFAILTIISGTNNYTVYIPIMWILVAMVLFSVLFTDDNKVFLVPLCMIFFALGSDAPTDAFYESGGDMLSYMHPSALGHIIAMGVVAVGFFIVRLLLDGSIAAALKKRRHFTVGIIAMDIAFLLNGIASPNYEFSNLAFGALLAAVLTAVYFFVCGMLESSFEPVKYGCVSMLCTAYVALIQILVVVLKLMSTGDFLIEYSGGTVLMNRNAIALGWGVSTVVSAVFVLGIPAAMYLARNCKASFISFFSCPILILGTLLINTRGPMLVGIITFTACAIACSIGGNNKRLVRIYSAITLIIIIAGIAFVIYNHPHVLSELLKFLRFDINIDSGRSELWENGWEDFKRMPLFGAGFSDGAYPAELKNKNLYSDMYHCIIIQWLGASGVVGCIAFLVHIFEIVILEFKRFTVKKLVLLAVPFMIILMSLFDNFFFYPHFQIFYAIFLSLAEKSYNQSKNISKGVI